MLVYEVVDDRVDRAESPGRRAIAFARLQENAFTRMAERLGRRRLWPASKPGEIVVVPFPFADRPSGDQRRSSGRGGIRQTEFAEQNGLYWIAMITSARNPGCRPTILQVPDDPGTGLPAQSVVGAAKIATLDERRLLRRLGRLPGAQWAQLAAYLKANLGRQ
ncbi:MAG: type II toxin-antitoxin system PemK/MazF family toxin [Rhodovibrio sp.]|nr:type II toxin-antitoxin system PemK/MazF family toxin [Rhodovibrio sp.]